MHKTIFAFAFAATLFAAHPSTVLSSDRGIPSEGRIDRAIDARELAAALAPIRSKAELDSYRVRAHGDSNDPLRALSYRNKQRFIDSLRFGTAGLASFSYVELESQLTATQAYRVLALFGAQDITPRLKGLRRVDSTDMRIMNLTTPALPPGDDDISIMQDYWCTSWATCEPRAGSICFATSC